MDSLIPSWTGCNGFKTLLTEYSLKVIEIVRIVGIVRKQSTSHRLWKISTGCLLNKGLIVFKVLLLAYRRPTYSGIAPGYLCDLVCLKEPTRWSLRSDDKLELQNPATRLKTYGDRCFEFAAAKEWNALPLRIKHSNSLDSFKSELKTFLFSQFYGTKK